MNRHGAVNPDPRRSLPSVDRIVRQLLEVDPALPAWAAAAAARQALQRARDAARTPQPGDEESHANVFAEALSGARCRARPYPEGVINATGVVLHTNLGRAPLASGAVQAAARAAGYAAVELDLATGRRGDRQAAVADKLLALCQGEALAALVVNNNAAAVLLALDALGRGREVVVSRGELVEIGGSFRVPEILERAGVRLVEVGTTNRTHVHDYERAIGPETALLLKVHRSNFEQRGFVAEVGIRELAALAHARGLPLIEDLGSATLLDHRDRGLPEESHAPSRLRAGADLVCFSADKLLGGPQAGVVLGRRPEHVGTMRRSPLARALRVDKLGLAALDWTLTAMLEGRAERELPVLRALFEDPQVVQGRAEALATRLREGLGRHLAGPSVEVRVEPTTSAAGGGSLPDLPLSSWAVTLRGERDAGELAGRLRMAAPPVLGRVRDGALWLDARTLLDEQLEALVASVESCLD